MEPHTGIVHRSLQSQTFTPPPKPHLHPYRKSGPVSLPLASRNTTFPPLEVVFVPINRPAASRYVITSPFAFAVAVTCNRPLASRVVSFPFPETVVFPTNRPLASRCTVASPCLVDFTSNRPAASRVTT